MLEFHSHTDLVERLSTNAFFVFMRCGNWTARNGATGIVPATLPFEVDHTPEQRPMDPQSAIDELEATGFWTPLPGGGWRMEFGPADEWDTELPLWRYSAPLGGVEVVPGFTVYLDPDM